MDAERVMAGTALIAIAISLLAWRESRRANATADRALDIAEAVPWVIRAVAADDLDQLGTTPSEHCFDVWHTGPRSVHNVRVVLSLDPTNLIGGVVEADVLKAEEPLRITLRIAYSELLWKDKTATITWDSPLQESKTSVAKLPDLSGLMPKR